MSFNQEWAIPDRAGQLARHQMLERIDLQGALAPGSAHALIRSCDLQRVLPGLYFRCEDSLSSL